jgi:hypothetical protein
MVETLEWADRVVKDYEPITARSLIRERLRKLKEGGE